MPGCFRQSELPLSPAGTGSASLIHRDCALQDGAGGCFVGMRGGCAQLSSWNGADGAKSKAPVSTRHTQRSLLGSQDARQPPCGWLSCDPSRLVTSGASKTVVLYVFRSTVTAGKSRSGHPWWGGHDLCHFFINFLLLIKRGSRKHTLQVSKTKQRPRRIRSIVSFPLPASGKTVPEEGKSHTDSPTRSGHGEVHSGRR